MDQVVALNGQGLTILLVEQNVGAALSVAERAYVLKDAVIPMADEARQLIDNPETVHAYLGR